MADLRVVLVSRELAPFGGAGIGTYVRATAEALAPIADVTLITTDVYEARYRELAAAADERLPPGRIVFVPEPRLEDLGNFYGIEHCWSARAYDALLRETREQPADVVEFPDYLGEGFVTVQAGRTADPALRKTAICVRLYTPGKITAILNGALPTHFYDRTTFELERFSLAGCDHLLWPGGDVLGSYQRWFGEALAPAVKVRHPVSREPGAEAPPSVPAQDAGLRILYLGRLERRKGVHNLIRALSSAAVRDWSLTMVGGDTDSGPLGQSMRGVLERMVGGDPRISFQDRIGREKIPALLAAHDLVVMPSLWECWPAVGLEALESGVPLLTTPVGGFTEMAQSGRSGWQSSGTGADALADALDPLLEAPEQACELRGTGRPREVFDELTDQEEVRERYAEIAKAARSRRPRRRSTGERLPPLVSVIIPYFRLHEYVEEAVASALEQTYRNIEVIVVNDGSFRRQDRILGKLAERYPISVLSQPNSGLGAARNAGIRQSSGRYVCPLDADDVLEPGFVERCVEVLESEPELVYVTSWLRYMSESGGPWESPESGYRPLGLFSELIGEQNVASSCTAVLRRRIFDLGYSYSEDLTSYEDWTLYRELHEANMDGWVVPEPLIRYRVRGDSMARMFGSPNLERQHREMAAHLEERALSWTP